MRPYRDRILRVWGAYDGDNTKVIAPAIGARNARLPARPRRPARDRRAHGDAVALRRSAPGRLPRRRRVLRAERLPDHDAARPGVGGLRHDRARPLLRAPGAAAVPGARTVP